jgi:S1-C subfamily serine protease
VTTSSGKRYPATLVGSFPPDDLAVIKVSGANLKPATFADSSKLQAGDLAIAIGNQLGLRVERDRRDRERVPPGRAGRQQRHAAVHDPDERRDQPGQLRRRAGRHPGSRDRNPTLAATDPELGGSAAPGIGFAIPSNLVKDIAGQIVANGKVVDSHRAYLGVRVGDTNGNGVYVGSVTAGGPAARAGLHAADVIVSVNGKPTPTTAVLSAVLAELRPGRQVALVVKPQNGAKTTVQVTLGTYPGS